MKVTQSDTAVAAPLARRTANRNLRLPVLTLIAAQVILPGCQKDLEPVFDGPQIVWPVPPEKPRVQYLGQLGSSADLKPPAKPLESLVDLFVGEKAPAVMYGPSAVWVSDDGSRVFVADSGGRCVHVFDLDSREYELLNSGNGEPFLSPRALCGGPGNTFFLVDSEAARVYQFDADSLNTRRAIDLPHACLRAVAVWFDPASELLWIVDVASHDILLLTLEGELDRVIGGRGREAGRFNFPLAIAVDGEQTRWVADSCNQRVQGLTADGEVVGVFGQPGDAPGEMALPKAIAVDAAGRLYILDSRFENIQIFDRQGKLLLVVGEEGNGPGQFWLPAGLHIDRQQRLWVADAYNRRVQVFQLLVDETSEPADKAEQKSRQDVD